MSVLLAVSALAVIVMVVIWTPRLVNAPAVPHGPVERLMAVGGFDTREELVDDALNFYDAMTEQVMKGNLVGYMDKDRQFTQVLTKGMKWAKGAGRVTGANEP